MELGPYVKIFSNHDLPAICGLLIKWLGTVPLLRWRFNQFFYKDEICCVFGEITYKGN